MSGMLLTMTSAICQTEDMTSTHPLPPLTFEARAAMLIDLIDRTVPKRLPTPEPTAGAELAYRIPGKGGFVRRTFRTEAAAQRFAEKLVDREGDDVEIRWSER